ncbi:SPOR domain-containing protein [Aequorivita sp. H23M31]|uniref:SPOR domain-containing protein n=1 Tax=Aequorivita ciconiae TaxID=2494375 RepID=A0A410G5N4_9FLAO|nr:HU-CCDC81 and SPOR domain-containing protein [Aequorivita sp. H23M31]QAA82569.1 SPOR domain-containing protein [Aequorivita sp. H23M31]
MQLSNYIADLLYRYECVIIPGFGAFLTRNQSARIEQATNTFYPPSKVLSFNRQLQVNDGLLANYVASAEKCSYETALQRVRKFSAHLNTELNAGNPISIKNIGEFSLNEERAIQFEPLNKQNFNTASFGLSSFVSPEISRIIQGETVVKTDKGVVNLATQQRVSRPYLKYAAVAAIALTASGFAGMKLYENQVQKYNFAQRQKANSLVENQIQEATFVIENPLPVINLELAKQIGKYHLVAGAYRLEENADKKIEQLREKGYSPMNMGVTRYGLHQVIYASFEERIDALKKLHEIQRDENPDAWLLVQEID